VKKNTDAGCSLSKRDLRRFKRGKDNVPTMQTFDLGVSVIQLTEPKSIYERPDYLARTTVGGVTVIGNRSDTALGAVQSLFFILTGSGGTEKSEEATVGLSLAVAGTDMNAVNADLAATNANIITEGGDDED